MGCYTYDNGGNILTKKTYAYTTGTLGTVQSTVNYGYGNSNWKDQLTSYNGTAITYDASGNPLNWRNASAMNWTGRQLDSMTLTDGTSVSFQYNSDGLRVSKTVGSDTVKYRWDGTTLLAEEHSDYTITFLYDDYTLIGFNYGGNNYYYGIDNLGVIHYVYNEAGTVVVTYTYDAWGNTISVSGDGMLININPIRYKSYYYDSETGLFYLQSRYYDAVVGRLISADDIMFQGFSGTVVSFNLYAYCENNPVNESDPYGLSPRWYHLAQGIRLLTTGLMALVSSIRKGFVKAALGSMTSNILGGLVGSALGFMPLGQYWGTIINVIIILSIVIQIKSLILNIPTGLWHLQQAVKHTHK